MKSLLEIKSLDEIKPSEETMMTSDLIRLFKSAGCSPTECHACANGIKEGETFKLVPHPNTDANGNVIDGFIDEMCCDNCGSFELKARDRRAIRSHSAHRARKIAQGGHGFSRPSMKV